MLINTKKTRMFLHGAIDDDQIDVPCLNDLQTESYSYFLRKGIGDCLKAISPIFRWVLSRKAKGRLSSLQGK